MRNSDLPWSETIDRVIDDESFRTFDRVGVEVMILDSRPDVDMYSYDGCKVEFNNPVPVVRDGQDCPDGETLGWANLYIQGKSLMADLFLRYDTPERLAIEVTNRVYPAAGHAILEADVHPSPIADYDPSEIENVPGRIECKHIEVGLVSLSPLRNPDDRIKPIS